MTTKQLITPIQDEKNGWSDLAQAAYSASQNAIGHRYSGAASIPTGAQITLEMFDALQFGYREWLVFNKMPTDIWFPA